MKHISKILSNLKTQMIWLSEEEEAADMAADLMDVPEYVADAHENSEHTECLAEESACRQSS